LEKNYIKIVNKRIEFSNLINDLFDIALQNALAVMNIDEYKEFLIKQREKERTGYINTWCK